MQWFIITGYLAICIALFSLLRLPRNRWTVPTAAIGGVVLSFTLIQALNFYHPHTGESRQYLATTPTVSSTTEPMVDFQLATEERNLVAWFHQHSLLRLQHGNAVEVSFDGIPGKVFAGEVRRVMPIDGDHPWSDASADANGAQPRIPVVIDITDPAFDRYVAQVPDGSRAQTVVYGESLQQLALVRKTLLRMSAWMNYLTPIS